MPPPNYLQHYSIKKHILNVTSFIYSSHINPIYYLLYFHKLFVVLHKQSHKQQVWWGGHCTHDHYKSTPQGWRAIFPAFSCQLLAFTPFVNNKLRALDKKTLVGFSVGLIKGNAINRYNDSLLDCFIGRKSLLAFHWHRSAVSHRSDVKCKQVIPW